MTPLRCLLTGLAAVILGGCSTTIPAPTARAPLSSAAAAETTLPVPDTTAEPSFGAPPTPPPDQPLIASIDHDGIRVTVTLERNPMPAGEPTWADLEVINVGADDVSWAHGCEDPAGLSGTLAMTWRPGSAQAGIAETLKSHLVRPGSDLHDGRISIGFTPEKDIGRGPYGCADVGVTEHLAPGEGRHSRARWDGIAHGELGLPPTGPMMLEARAGSYWRTSKSFPGADLSRIVFQIPAWITHGKPAALLDPPEAIDAALRDAAFIEWLGHQLRTTVRAIPGERSYSIDAWSGKRALLRFDRALGQWHIGVLRNLYAGGGRMHEILIDPVTGAVRGVLDYAVDRY
jgi:hypothetical protein